MTTLRLAAAPAPPAAGKASLKADALLVAVRPVKGKPQAAGAEALDAALGKRLSSVLADLGASGKPGEVHRFSTLGAFPVPSVVAVGAGDQADDLEALRRAVGNGVRSLAGVARVAIAVPAADPATVQAVAEGALLAAYSFDDYRFTSKGDRKAPVAEVTLLVDNPKDKALVAAARRSEVVAEAVSFVRDMVNTPPGDLPPAKLAEIAAGLGKEAGLSVEVLDEKALKKGGYGGILGVGQGSSRPPRLVRLGYTHPKARATVALVGKGITFDSGGLSIKPAASMETMKMDMAGAASVVATVVAAAALKLPVNVTAWAPMAENMPSGSAIRPSDVLTMLGGKRVEVLNTDAEGRLILADALTRASQEAPDVIVDVATLTGACVVALGTRTAGVMSNDDDFREQVVSAARTAGELMWPLPLPAELRPTMDTEIADLANMGDRMGGALVAGLFLKEFVGEGIRWAHLDIAGPAYHEGAPYGYTHTGGTGHAVRTLVTLVEQLAAS